MRARTVAEADACAYLRYTMPAVRICRFDGCRKAAQPFVKSETPPRTVQFLNAVERRRLQS